MDEDELSFGLRNDSFEHQLGTSAVSGNTGRVGFGTRLAEKVEYGRPRHSAPALSN